MSQGSRPRDCCQHTTSKRQATAENNTGRGNWCVGYDTTGTSHLWNSSPKRHPRGAPVIHMGRTRRDFREGPAKKPIGTRCHRLLEGETRRLLQDHPSVGVCVRGTALSGDGGVPCPRCGATDASRVIVSSMGCAGQPALAPGPLALPHF